MLHAVCFYLEVVYLNEAGVFFQIKQGLGYMKVADHIILDGALFLAQRICAKRQTTVSDWS